MSTSTLTLTPKLYTYMLEHSLRESALLAELREETAGHPRFDMQIAPEQGQFMALLVRLMNAKRILEVGVFTGYSSLCMVQAMGPDGEMVACDISPEYTEVARRYWKRAGVQHRISLRIGPATETLRALREDGEEGTFDMAFIDADKEPYAEYYEHALRLVRPGGLIMFDNMLAGGAVVDDSARDDATLAIRHLNDDLHTDDRVDISLVPIGDGLTLARKRGD